MTTDALHDARQELARTRRELHAAQRDRDKALTQWTSERTRLHEQNRMLRVRVRELERVLYRYLEGKAAT